MKLYRFYDETMPNAGIYDFIEVYLTHSWDEFNVEAMYRWRAASEYPSRYFPRHSSLWSHYSYELLIEYLWGEP